MIVNYSPTICIVHIYILPYHSCFTFCIAFCILLSLFHRYISSLSHYPIGQLFILLISLSLFINIVLNLICSTRFLQFYARNYYINYVILGGKGRSGAPSESHRQLSFTKTKEKASLFVLFFCIYSH